MAGQKEKPLSAEELKFCTLYVRFRDIYKAADRAKIKRGNAVRTILLVELWHHELNEAEIEFFQRLSVLGRASQVA